MSEEQFQLARAAVFVFAVALAAGLQAALPHGRLRGSWRTNTGLWAINLVVIGAVCGACACTTARWAAGVGIGGLNAAAAVPFAVSIPVTVLFLDSVSYAWHRANHRISFLWRFHRVHHSDPAFTASTAFRFHPGELLLSLPLRLAAVVGIGAPVEGVVVFEAMFMVANLVEHGDIALPGRLERRLASVLVMPSLHRRHHSRVRAELDSNFGTIFTFWDRLFGTFGDSGPERRFRIGLVEIDGPVSLVRALRLPASTQ